MKEGQSLIIEWSETRINKNWIQNKLEPGLYLDSVLHSDYDQL